jgi:predicted RND superfamily exporter protein
MFYHTPDVRPFIQTIIKYRIVIITSFILLLSTLLFLFKPLLVSSEELFWLSESKAYEKNKDKDFTTKHLSRLTIVIPEFNQQTLDKLYALQKQIQSHENVLEVDTILGAKNIYNDDDTLGSSMVRTSSLSALNAKQIKALVVASPESYSRFIDSQLSQYYIYIYASQSVDIDELNLGFQHKYSHPNDSASLNDYLIYVLSIVLSIVILFRLLFHNFFSSLIALLIIFITLVSTMALSALVTGVNAFYLSMALIVVAVSLVDYLYFYYRWHVSQYKADVSRAMCKAINRNISPALWTTFITFMGLGALLLVDSIVVKHLSIAVIAASTLTYVLNITLLPALLSFYKVSHPKIGFARLGYAFAKLEVHYSHGFFRIFMFVSLVLMLVGSYQVSQNVKELFETSEKSGMISAKLPLYDLDYELVEKINAFESALQKEFSLNIRVDSVAKIINTLHSSSYSKDLDEESFLEAKMFLELYNLDIGLVDERSMKILLSFDPNHTSKSSLLNWLEQQSYLDLYLIDVDSLISRAKSQASLVLAASVVSALILIGLIMGWMFRSKTMILIALVVNALPMIWFGFVLYLLGIPLNIEALIAMTIALALGSDASVHFAYKYFRSRYFNRSLKHSLEKLFFYSGVPVLIGSLILVMVFLMLTLTSVHSLQLIGMNGAILMLFSLLTDMFILPVMLLAFDRHFKRRGDTDGLYKGDSCEIIDGPLK